MLGLEVVEDRWEEEPLLFSREPAEEEEARGYISTLGLEREVSATLPPAGRWEGRAPWAAPEDNLREDEEADEAGEEDEEAAAGGAFDSLSFFGGPAAGGRVRGVRTTGGRGGHSFPSRTGGGPVRRLEEEGLSLGPLAGAVWAQAGASVEEVLLMRWVTAWCIHSTSGYWLLWEQKEHLWLGGPFPWGARPRWPPSLTHRSTGVRRGSAGETGWLGRLSLGVRAER